MQLGLFTALFADRSLDDLLDVLKGFPEISALEIGCGGWPGQSHIEPERLLADRGAAREYLSRLADHGLRISALSCHGNPVHPDDAIAGRDRAIFERTVRLAERLAVPVVVTFSGCPGGGAADRTPNWITTAWPPECADALEWQWNERLIPYWKEAERMAASAGVRVALEAHPGFCVYNPETLLRLRHATGPALGINLDPSHLWWQGIDPRAAIVELDTAIFHFHAKDVALNEAAIGRNGVLDSKNYRQAKERAWSFRTVGWGHGELVWKEIVSALRLVGYDFVLSIEHEDALLSRQEGLRSAVATLSRVLLKEPPCEPWWT